jgi:hypothetical protein
MQLDRPAATLLAAATAGYTARLIDDTTIAAIVFLYVGVLVLAVLCSAAAIFAASSLLLRLLPRGTREYSRKHITRFRTVVYTCTVFLFLVGWAVNRYLLPHRYHPVSWIGNSVILLFAVVLVGCVLRPSRKKMRTLASSAVLFVVSISALGIVPRVGIPKHSTSLDALGTLGYVTWVPAEGTMDKSGVTYYDRGRSWQGINIYTPRNLSTAYLIDMSGNVLHEWSANFFDDDIWVHVELCENGDLLTFVTDRLFVKLGWDSGIKWKRDLCAHHDIAVAENGDIHVLTRSTEIVTFHGLPAPIYDNYIVILSSEGEYKNQASLFELLKETFSIGDAANIYTWFMRPANLKEIIQSEKCRGPSDLIHANTIEIIGRDIDDVFKKGNILFCARTLDMVGVIDAEKKALLWTWGPGELEHPHHPTLLESGNILIFDNGVRRRYSRVVELDPQTGRIVWEYAAEPKEGFFSQRAGASQRLPNGNTLITSSDEGRVFEVTHDGQIVWEFYSPEMRADKGERSAIYRMMRITDLDAYDLPESLQQGGP